MEKTNKENTARWPNNGGWLIRTMKALFTTQSRGASALGKQKGGFHWYAHTGASKTFKMNRRKELKARSRRQQGNP